MILDGNAKVGKARVYATETEMKQAKYIEKIEKENNEIKIKLDSIEKYCKPHLKLMWAARIVGIIKDCDFRDCEREIKKDLK